VNLITTGGKGGNMTREDAKPSWGGGKGGKGGIRGQDLVEGGKRGEWKQPVAPDM